MQSLSGIRETLERVAAALEAEVPSSRILLVMIRVWGTLGSYWRTEGSSAADRPRTLFVWGSIPMAPVVAGAAIFLDDGSNKSLLFEDLVLMRFTNNSLQQEIREGSNTMPGLTHLKRNCLCFCPASLSGSFGTQFEVEVMRMRWRYLRQEKHSTRKL